MSATRPNIAAILPAKGANHITEERPIPSPKSGELLIRNHALAVNPIDWKRQAFDLFIPSYPVVLGSDVSGIVVEVGPSVTGFKPGDRVLGIAQSFVNGNSDYAAFQTYTIVRAIAATKIPENISFEQASTMPQGVTTVTMALVDILGLPLPTGKSYSESALSPQNAILIWGGASSVGFIGIQIARLLGLTVFATASKQHHEKLQSIGAAEVFDYKSPTVVADIVEASKRVGKRITYGFDTITTPESIDPLMEVLTAQGFRYRKAAFTGYWPAEKARVQGIEAIHVPGEDLVDRRDDLCAWLFNHALPKWLEDGSIEPIGHQVVEGGLGGIQDAMNQLKEGVSGKKLIVKV